jgi:hypothetical protein
MSLIMCSECRREISDRAAVCPHCGCPVSAFVDQRPWAGAVDAVSPVEGGPVLSDQDTGSGPPRILALLLAALAVPGFAVNPIMGAMFAIGALNVWTNLGKRPFFGSPGNPGRRSARRWALGVLTVAIVVVGACAFFALLRELGIKAHLFRTWNVTMNVPGREAGVDDPPDLMIEVTGTMSLKEPGGYRSEGLARWTWKHDGRRWSVSWQQHEAGAWKLSGHDLRLTPSEARVEEFKVEVDGAVQTDPDAWLPLRGKIRASEFEKILHTVVMDTTVTRVREIDAGRMVLEVVDEEGEIDPYPVTFRPARR